MPAAGSVDIAFLDVLTSIAGPLHASYMSAGNCPVTTTSKQNYPKIWDTRALPEEDVRNPHWSSQMDDVLVFGRDQAEQNKTLLILPELPSTQ